MPSWSKIEYCHVADLGSTTAAKRDSTSDDNDRENVAQKIGKITLKEKYGGKMSLKRVLRSHFLRS